MDGLSGPGRLTPEDPKYEVSKMGSFQSRVENVDAAGGIDGDQESRKRKKEKEEEQKESVIVDLDSGELSQKVDNKDNRKGSTTYTIKFNKNTGLVDLVNLKDGVIVQSINPDELVSLVSGLRDASGVFVDNEI